MRKKAQVLIISLWILVILTVLAVSIGHRVSLGLRLSRYQRDGLKALYLAKAGVNRAIAVLEADAKSANNYDALCESWASNKDLFEKIKLTESDDEFASVNYIKDPGSAGETVYGVTDEENRVNLNTASAELINALLSGCPECGFSDAQISELVDYTRVWRGDQDPALNPSGDEYKDFKKKPFTNPEELAVVFELYYRKKQDADFRDKAAEAFNNIRDKVTVYSSDGSGKININTVSQDMLVILANSVAAGSEEKNCAAKIAQEIIRMRDEKNGNSQAFASADDIVINFGDDIICLGLLDKLKDRLIFKSGHYRINATGTVGRLTKKIAAVYSRADQKIVYWYQN